MSDIKINNITDRSGSSGPIFAGISTVSTEAFMVMPSGPTEYRGGRGRGILWVNSAPSTKTLNKFEIATTGNADDFGDSMVSKSLPGVKEILDRIEFDISGLEGFNERLGDLFYILTGRYEFSPEDRQQ